ncbi:Panacea domain-containing protein [Rhizobium johnstonii]
MNFFLSNTKKCGKVKLFKLLYFLDFEHFKQTGRSVTGMDYYAWKMGPVPVDLHEEIESPEPDMAENFRFEERPIRNGEQTMLLLTPQKAFSEEHFSRREMKIMRDLVARYAESLADEMIEATHLESQPWHKVFVQQDGKQQRIPYMLAVSDAELELIETISAERKDTLKSLQ